MAKFVRRTQNRPTLYEGPPCAKNRPRALPRPKIGARRSRPLVRPPQKYPKTRWAIGLGGGAGQVRPPDSEWGQTLRGASVYKKLAAGTAAPNNKCPKVPSPSSSAAKMPKKRVGYSLGGRGWPSSSAGLGMGPDFARGLRVPKIGRGHCRAQK